MARSTTHLVGVKHDGEQPLERCFIHYSPPPSIMADGNFVLGAKEDWLERIEFFIGDTTWLLELNQKEFWDQMISNKKAMIAIISFLQEATPHYMLDTFPVDEDMWKMFQKAQFLVFLIFNRLTTCVESDSEILTTDKVGQMLYNNYLITIPIILDLCLIYGQSNRAQISTIVNNIFEMQPNYTEDLIKAVPFFSKVLRNVERNFAGADKALHNGELTKLSERGGVGTLKALQDCIFHVLDTATNLSIFLDIYTPACHILHEQLFENTMVTFYENTLPTLYERLEQIANTPSTQLIYADLRLKLDLARVEMLKIFRLILSSIVSRVVEQSSSMSEDETKELAEDYVNVLTAAVAEKTFVRDYHTAYPVDLDLDILSQLCPEMDALKCDYILEAVLACFDTPPQRNAGNAEVRSASSTTSTTTTAMTLMPTAVVAPTTTKPTKRIGGVELESLISQVKDILPHLGDGFVLSCLEHFEYASDAVINAVLEETLPGNLKAMDFSMPRTLEVSNEEDDLSKGLQRLNVFDNDEFDIMTRDDIDTSRIHFGKKREEHRDLASLLDDKRHRTEFRDTYTKLGLVDASVDAGLYDDEYDDTYDAVDVSVAEAGETERRPFVVPRVLRTQEAESSSEEEAAAPSGTNGSYVRPTLGAGAFVPFAQNPEELRARAEERRLAKRGGGRGGHRGGDVVGVAKGHGQEKSVTISREKKTQRGNQNRRSGAARKRNQGMIPS